MDSLIKQLGYYDYAIWVYSITIRAKYEHRARLELLWHFKTKEAIR